MLYPPTMNAAGVLADNGWSVDIVGIRIPTGDHIECPSNVTVQYFDSLRKGLSLRVQFLLYVIWTALISRRNTYSFILAYDFMAVIPAFVAARMSRCIWGYHNHDLMASADCKGFYAILKYAELRLARKACVLSFPQFQRSQIFKTEANLTCDPHIVFNAPRLGWPNITIIDERIIKFKQRVDKIILHQGNLTSRRGLDILIDTLPYLENNVGLCLVGKEQDSGFKDQALSRAVELGVSARLLILDVVSYNELPSITNACDIGLAVPIAPDDASCLNIQYLAGASNKIFEYMACGLPIVAPNAPAYRDLIQPPKHGVLYERAEPICLAESLKILLDDFSLREEISHNNICAFNQQFNYDHQFKVIIDSIKKCIPILKTGNSNYDYIS